MACRSNALARLGRPSRRCRSARRSAYVPPIMVKPISRSRLLTSWNTNRELLHTSLPCRRAGGRSSTCVPGLKRPVIQWWATTPQAWNGTLPISLLPTASATGRCGVEGSTDRGFSCNLTRHLDGSLKWPRDARILREFIDVAVRRTEVHPGITAFVLFSKENFNPVGPKLAGGCSDIVNKEACNWTRCEVTIDVAVGVQRPPPCYRPATSTHVTDSEPGSQIRPLGSFLGLPPSAAAPKLILIMLIFTGRFTSTLMIGWRRVPVYLPTGRATCRWVSGHRLEHQSVPALLIEPMICVPATTAVHSVGFERLQDCRARGS
jgi:hypothetical protein